MARPGGTVAACVWVHAGDRGPLAAFWSAVRGLDPANPGESDLTGVREGQLASVFTQAGLAARGSADGPGRPGRRRDFSCGRGQAAGAWIRQARTGA